MVQEICDTGGSLALQGSCKLRTGISTATRWKRENYVKNYALGVVLRWTPAGSEKWGAQRGSSETRSRFLKKFRAPHVLQSLMLLLLPSTRYSKYSKLACESLPTGDKQGTALWRCYIYIPLAPHDRLRMLSSAYLLARCRACYHCSGDIGTKYI